MAKSLHGQGIVLSRPLTRRHQVIPQGQVVRRVAQAVDFVTELAGEPGARDIDLLATEIEEPGLKVTHVFADPIGGCRAHDLHGCRSLDLDYPRLRVRYGDVVSLAVGTEPGLQCAVRLHVPETIVGEPENDTVHEHAALRCAGDGVASAPGLEGRDSPREDLLQERHGVGSGHLHRFLGRVEHEGLASQNPVLPDRVLSIENGEEAARVNAPHQLRTVVAGAIGRFFEAPSTDADGAVAVLGFLQIHSFCSLCSSRLAADEPGKTMVDANAPCLDFEGIPMARRDLRAPRTHRVITYPQRHDGNSNGADRRIRRSIPRI